MKQFGFNVGAAVEAAQRAVGADDAVARDFRVVVLFEDIADGPIGQGPPGAGGDFFVGKNSALRNSADNLKNFFSK